MEQDPRLSDNVARGDAPGSAVASESSRTDGRAVDNAARARAAERERTFTSGGDDNAAGGPPPVATVGAPSLVAAASARIRGLERPSPFGVGQFPPLPPPPGMTERA